LSLEYVEAGSPVSSHYQTLGTFSLGVFQDAWTLHGLFFALGAILWYYLFFQSRLVPRLLSVWGLLGAFLVLLNTLLILWDSSLGVGSTLWLVMGILNILFELAIGLWLVIKGTDLTRVSGESRVA
jgi:hypothetical protein